MAKFPTGAPAPSTGEIPAVSLSQVDSQPFTAYIHVPFCAKRCGYCDFNTYTPTELNDQDQYQRYLTAVLTEIEFAAARLPQMLPLTAVFFGGGTPTQLSSAALIEILAMLRLNFGLAPEAEISIEANPDSVTPSQLSELVSTGFNRISFGMQSAVPKVLQILDRTHHPEGVAAAVSMARAAGFSQLNIDLIYGTPGETLLDWQQSVNAALALAPDHVSAYALIVEDGTQLARRVKSGQVLTPDSDDLADKYELADRLFTAAGLQWYEVSNWARNSAAQCSHNLNYWQSGNWWGFGPGAHSHIAGTRWWNQKHPNKYADLLAEGLSPALAREVLTSQERWLERVLLETRLASGLAADLVPSQPVKNLITTGLLEQVGEKFVLTDQGRLLADLVVRQLTE